MYPGFHVVEILGFSCHGDDAVALELYRREPSDPAVTALPVVPDLEVLEDRVRQVDWLLCPKCGEGYTHLDEVFVAGRPHEDGGVKPVHVDSSGTVTVDDSLSLPIPDLGRRHVITIEGWCEMCSGHITIEFKQHKGQTHLAIREPRWEPLTPSAKFD